MPPRPRVGIVIPAFQAERWLDVALASVRAQTFQNWAAVVVDDGSSDRTGEIARMHAAIDRRIRVIDGPGRQGPVGAPLARACGRAALPDGVTYLAFPDADDVLDPLFLKVLVDRLDQRPGAGAAYCRAVRVDGCGALIAEPPIVRWALSRRWVRPLDDDEAASFESIYSWQSGAMEGVTVLRADVYDSVGGWGAVPEQGGESVDLLCRIALSHDVLFEPLALYRYRRHDDQHSADDTRKRAAEDRLRRRWRELAARDPRIAPFVRRGEFFLEHRLVPRVGGEIGVGHLRRGRVIHGARFIAGAARRYRWRVPVPASSTTDRYSDR